MRGHQTLLDMRRAGFVPHYVRIECDDIRLGRSWCHGSLAAGVVEVQIGTDDALHRLDLRCLAGLVVAVSGGDAKRVEAVSEAVSKAGAVRVIATTHDDAEGHSTVVRVTDTAGILTWPN